MVAALCVTHHLRECLSNMGGRKNNDEPKGLRRTSRIQYRTPESPHVWAFLLRSHCQKIKVYHLVMLYFVSFKTTLGRRKYCLDFVDSCYINVHSTSRIFSSNSLVNVNTSKNVLKSAIDLEMSTHPDA